MLASLFGDLGGPRNSRRPTDGDDHGFAATKLMERVDTQVNDQGQMVDRHHSDLVVVGSPASAIRDHFSTTRSDLETASRQITLLDPLGVWASAVIRALSDAGGRPIERLHLREQTTLRTLATVERTTLVRRQEETLKIYHADVRAPGRESAEIPMALMESSHLAVVVIGPLQPHSVDGLLASLLHATLQTHWRCPNLLFMVPPGAVWIDNKIRAICWPAPLQVHVLNEPLTSASAVWNAMLGMWSQVKTRLEWNPQARTTSEGGPALAEFPIRLSELQTPAIAPSTSPATLDDGSGKSAPRGSSAAIDLTRAREALAGLIAIDGFVGCALVEAQTGVVVAQETRREQPVDLELCASATAQLLRAHRQAARSMGMTAPIDEVMTAAGQRLHLTRTLTRRPEWFLVALLDKHRANFALARFKLMEAEKSLF